MVVVKAQPLQRALNAALPQGVQFQRETKLHLPAEINLVLLTGLFGFVGDFFFSSWMEEHNLSFTRET